MTEKCRRVYPVELKYSDFFFFFFGLEGRAYDGKELHVRVRVYDNVGIFLG